MVFYFTGTGNSLYVAKQLEEERYSIPQEMKKANLEYTAERIGIVCPVYGHEVPDMVKEFLKRAKFHTQYFYMVLTFGRRHGGAAKLAENILEDVGVKPNYINIIMMVDNFLPSFDMEEQIAIDGEKKVDENINQIKKDIDNKVNFISPVTQEDRDWHQTYLAGRAKMPADAFVHMFHITEDCIGCGICTKVCPSGCYQIKDDKAVQNPEGCQVCLSCIHNCPKKAIGLNMPEKNPNARYRNEHIDLQEIIDANNQ
ncbi:ferredoxin [Lachnospiraceae bacterium KM106-2]|nr:ferredoxin [Lachnospiraceae bacterium KM106-2]